MHESHSFFLVLIGCREGKYAAKGGILHVESRNKLQQKKHG
jgi:hypothetical protein